MGKKKRTTRKRQRGGLIEYEGMSAHCEKYNGQDDQFACGASKDRDNTMVISQEINRLSSTNNNLEEQNARLAENMVEIKQKMSNLTKQLADANEMNAMLQEEKKDLNDRNQKLEEEKNERYKRESELQEELEQAKSEIDKKLYADRLRDKKLEELESDNEKLKYKNEKLIDENNSLQKKLDDRTETWLPKTQSEQMKKMEELEAANEKLKSDNDEMQKVIQGLRTENTSLRTTILSLESHMERVKNGIEERESNIERVKDRLIHRIPKEDDDKDISSRYEKLESLLNNDLLKDDKYVSIRNELIIIKDTFDFLYDDYDKLKEEVQNLKQGRVSEIEEKFTLRLNELIEEKQKLMERIDELEKQLEEQYKLSDIKPSTYSNIGENKRDAVLLDENPGEQDDSDRPNEPNDLFEPGNPVGEGEEMKDMIDFYGGKRTLPRRKNKTHKHCTQKQSTHKHRSQKQSTHKHRSQKHIKKKHSPSKVKTRRKKSTIRRRH